MQYGSPEIPQRTHFSYNGKCLYNDTSWRGSSGTVQYFVYQLMGTVGKYIMCVRTQNSLRKNKTEIV